MNSTPPKLDTGTRLAADRTRLAHERTQMAWVRTATSLISFGFTIYKFFQFEGGAKELATSSLVTPRQFAMVMIGTGLAALVLSSLDHRRSIRALHLEFGEAPRSTAGIVAGIVAVMGVLAFFTTLFRG